MNTAIGRQLAEKFSTLKITEDVFSDSKYWVNVHLESCSVVIENAGEQGFGVSVVENGILDFGGHDDVVDSVDDAIKLATKRITDLTTTNNQN